jgi:hypothetical protein
MVWNAGVGLWWAATAEIFKGCGFKLHCLPELLARHFIHLNQNFFFHDYQSNSTKSSPQTMHPVLLA